MSDLSSVLILQRINKKDEDIENQLGLKIKQEHRMKNSFDYENCHVDLIWLEVPEIGNINKDHYTGVITFKSDNKILAFDINAVDFLHWIVKQTSFDDRDAYENVLFNKEEDKIIIQTNNDDFSISEKDINDALTDIQNILVNRIFWFSEISKIKKC